MRILLKSVGVIIILILILLAVGIGQLDRIVKEAVETVAPQFTQSDVTLGGVDISLTDGKGTLSDLAVSNPAGFNTPMAFELSNISVQLNVDSLTTNTIIVESVVIDAPRVTYESGKQGSNLDVLQRNIAKSTDGDSAPSQESSDSQATESQAKIIIRDLVVSNGAISYNNALLGDSTIYVPLPKIHLTGIGEKSNGATVGEVIKLILTEINSSSIKAVTNSNVINDMGNKAKEAISEQTDTLKGLFDKLKK